MSHQNFRNWISALEEPRAAQSKFSLWSTGQLNHQPPRLHQAQAIHTAHNLCGLVVVRSFDFTFTPDTCRFYSIPKSLGMAIPKLEKALMAPLVIDVRSPYPCGYGKKHQKSTAVRIKFAGCFVYVHLLIWKIIGFYPSPDTNIPSCLVATLMATPYLTCQDNLS